MLRRSIHLVRISLAVLFVLSACAAPPPADEGAEPIRLELGGEYRGRYWVTHNDGTSEQRRQDGPVWMKFENGEYQIDGDYEYLPPVGGGTYRMDGSVLVLDDTAVHTANFDWSLILKGRFEFDMGRDGVVRLTQRDLEYGRYHELELRPEGP